MKNTLNCLAFKVFITDLSTINSVHMDRAFGPCIWTVHMDRVPIAFLGLFGLPPRGLT